MNCISKDGEHYSIENGVKTTILFLFDMKAQEKSVVYDIFHEKYFVKDSLYKGIVILFNEKEEIPAKKIETSDINGEYFPDSYERIESFKFL